MSKEVLPPGPLAAYNSLEDKHLAAYFSSARMRRHLRRVGLIKRSGELVSERAYKLQVARKEHQERVREVLAQAILDKALHMEHYRQAAIRRKLEEISKLKRIRRIQTARGQQAERDALRILQPHPPPERRTGPRSGGTSDGASPESPTATSSAEAEESSRPLTAPEQSSRPQRLQPLRTAVSLPCPTRLNQLEREMLQKLTGRTTFLVEPHPPPSPYVLPLICNRVASTGSNHHHQQQLNSRSNEALRSRTSAQPLGTRRGRVLRISASQGHASPPAEGDGKVGSGSQPRLRTLVPRPPQPRGGGAATATATVEVSMVYLGKRGRPSREQVLGDEVRVMQQHCGGESLCVFHGRLKRGEAFRFRSRRLGGFPFSLSLYVDGLLIGRLSWCCEFRHRQGGRLSGGRLSHFSLTGVQGAAPCYRCIIAQGLDIQPFPPAKRKGGDRERAAHTEPPRTESVEQPLQQQQREQHSSTEESDSGESDDEEEDVDVDDDDDDDGDGDRDEAAASSGKTAPNEYMEDFEEEEEEELEEEMEEQQQKVKEEDTGEVVEKCPGSGGGGVVETHDEPRGFDDGAGDVTDESDGGSVVEGGSATVGSANRETNVRSSPAHSSEDVGEDEEEADEKRNNEEEETQGEIPDDDWDRETPSPLRSYMEEEDRDDDGDVTTRGGSSHSTHSEENAGREGRGTVASDEESGHGSDATEVDVAAGQDGEEEWDEATGDGDGNIPAAAAMVVGDDASSGGPASVAHRISTALSHTERRAASEPELSSDSSNSEDEDTAVAPVAAVQDSSGSDNGAIGPDGKTDAEADDNAEESGDGDHEAAVKDLDAKDVASEWEAETSAVGREVATVATEDDSLATKGMKNDDNQGANDVTNEGEVSQRTPRDEPEAPAETSDVMDAGGLGVTDADLKEDTKAQDGALAEAEDRAPSQVQNVGSEEKAEVENYLLEEAEAQDGAVVEVAEAQDGAVVEEVEVQDGVAVEEADAQDGAAEEEAEAQDGAVVEEAEAQDGAAEEEAEAQDGAVVEEAEAQDGALVEEAEAQDGAVVEEAEAQDGAAVEEADAQDGAAVKEAEVQDGVEAKAQDGAEAEEAKAQDGAAVEEAEAQGGAPIEEAEAQDGALGEETDTQDGASTEASEAQGGPLTEETEAHDKAPVEEAEAKDGVPTDKFKVQDGAPTEEAEAQSGAPSGEAEDEDGASSQKVEAQDRASSEEAEAQDGAPVAEAEAQDGAPPDEIKFQSGVETEETEVQCEAPSAEVEAQDETSAEKHENTISDKAMDGDVKHQAHGVQCPGEEAPQADNGFQDKDLIEAVANIENGVTSMAHTEDSVAAQEDENKGEGATDTLSQQQQEGLNSVQESPAEVGLDTHDESPCNGQGDHEGTAEQEQREDRNPETKPNSEELERDEKKPPKLWKKLSQRVLSFNEHQDGEAAMDERGDQKPDPDKQAKVKQAKVQGDVDTKEIEAAVEKVVSAQEKTPVDKSRDVVRAIVRNEAAEENTEPGDARPDDGDHARADDESDGSVVKAEASQQVAEAQKNDLGDAVEPGDTLQAGENTDAHGASQSGPGDSEDCDADPEEGTKRSSGSTAEDLDGKGHPRNKVGDGHEGGTEKSNAASRNGEGDGEADGNKKPRLWKQLSKRVLSWSEQQNGSSPMEEAEMGGKREEGPHGGAETHGGADNRGGELQCGASTEEAVVHQGSCREREQRPGEEAARVGDVKAPTGDTETGEDETLSGEAGEGRGDSNGVNLDLVASDDKPAESEDNPAT
ncbi:glutamate-rich protein 3-like isoform X2 [Lethenteron reissneri]|uniref:glutamate-rich protein 3-like isoform X2 n=1 Tax=Lethenteron reissneri TaxID=7753 RepID=UPI002AB60194|nr:glutamate-rich protein 3-like isoform X2 [Lethenteron reissneri]